MITNRNYASTKTFQKYKDRDVSEFNTFGEVIACLRVNFDNGPRKKKGLSLTETFEALSEMGCKVSIQYIRLLENNKRKNPSAKLVKCFEILFSLTPGTLTQYL